MKGIVLILICCMVMSCNKYQGVPEKYHVLLDSALTKAGVNRPELALALKSAPDSQKEGVAFLIAYMPERDLVSMKAARLLKDVDLAYQTRERFMWAKIVPDSIFLNDVLPYVSLNEERDAWREDFYKRFAPYVEQCSTMEEVIKEINHSIRDEVKVDYNTNREKPDQCPSESIRQGMASCSGLSILLVDALRAVGVPARVAGTANWHDNRGNHNWCEVWIEGEWFFTEYYPDELNRSWFLADAGKADPNDREHAIWASSFKPTGESFPLVWDESIDYVPAVNVTQRYLDVYKTMADGQMADGNHVKMLVRMFKDARCTLNSDDRVATNVDVFCGADQIGGGRTAGPMQDMNDVLEFIVEKDKDYTLKYWNEAGKAYEKRVEVKGEPVDVKIYY